MNYFHGFWHHVACLYKSCLLLHNFLTHKLLVEYLRVYHVEWKVLKRRQDENLHNDKISTFNIVSSIEYWYNFSEWIMSKWNTISCIIFSEISEIFKSHNIIVNPHHAYYRWWIIHVFFWWCTDNQYWSLSAII